jgi:hypothetical protein
MERRVGAVALSLALVTVTSEAGAQTRPVTIDAVRAASWLVPLYRPVLTRALPRFTACATTAWATAPTVAGTLTVGFSVYTTAPVLSLRVLNNGLVPAAPDLVACVLRVTRRLPFPNDIEGSARVSFTLRFAPAAPVATSHADATRAPSRH